MEVVQGMMAQMQKQNAENLATLARQQFRRVAVARPRNEDDIRYDRHAWNRPPSIIQGRRGQVRRMEGETLGVLACRCPELRLVDPMVWAAAELRS